jgi:hypothetical protein
MKRVAYAIVDLSCIRGYRLAAILAFLDAHKRMENFR